MRTTVGRKTMLRGRLKGGGGAVSSGETGSAKLKGAVRTLNR